MKRLRWLLLVALVAVGMLVVVPVAGAAPPHHSPAQSKCNSGGGNGSELVNGVDCDPGNSGGRNNGGD